MRRNDQIVNFVSKQEDKNANLTIHAFFFN